MFSIGTRLIAIRNGLDFGSSYPQALHVYGTGWIGTLRDGNVIDFDNGRSLRGCSHNNFEVYVEDRSVTSSTWGERTR